MWPVICTCSRLPPLTKLRRCDVFFFFNGAEQIQSAAGRNHCNRRPGGWAGGRWGEGVGGWLDHWAAACRSSTDGVVVCQSDKQEMRSANP